MRQRYAVVAALVLAVGLVAFDLDVALIRPVLALAALLGLPTVVLFHKVRFLGDHAPARLLYAFGASLLGLILVGLVLNTLLPLVGVDRPLQPVVLAVAALLVDLGLLAWWQRSGTVLSADPAVVVRRVRDARLELAQALAVCSAVLAVAGAVRLNNGAGGGVAVAALVLGVAALLALMVRPEGSRSRDLLCLGLVAMSLLLATSLRGWSITGHDIASEYLTFVLTNDAQRWQMSSWENAYNACLSLNILPTILSQATGLSGVVVFKVLLQLVFALVPVMTFLLAGRFLPRRLALASAVITMALPTFYTDMPYLVRQEIAFFFLALLLLAATAPTAGRRRLLLVGFFGVGVVLSHYSTTYVMLLGLGLGLLALVAWRLVRRTRWLRDRFPERARPRLVLLNPAVIVLLALTSWVWAGPVTDTGGHATEVARDAIAAVLGKGEDVPGSSDLGYTLFSGPRASPRERLDLFVAETMKARAQASPRDLLIRKPGKAELRPDIVPASRTPLTGLGTKVESLGLDANVAITVLRVGSAALLQILLLVGLVWMIRRRRETIRPLQDDESQIVTEQRGVPEEAVFLTFGAVAALGVVVLIPQLSVDYGVLRAFQQTLLLVAPVVAMGLWVVVRHWKVRASALTIAVPLGLLLVFSGAIPSLLGGYQGRLALSNSGLYYERYYASESDVQAVDWVAAADRATSRPPKIIANRNIGVRMLSANPDATVADRLYPTLLTKGSYVFVDSRLEQTGHAGIFYTGDFISYRYPLSRLDRRLDLVYSSAHTRIYR